MQKLLVIMGADVWIEGEDSHAHNFGDPIAAPGASASAVLVLNTSDDPPLAPYSASFKIDADSNASYEIWLAATAPNEGSPMTYDVDGIDESPVVPIDATVEDYAPGLSWYKVGAINLTPGNHTLTITSTGRRPQDNRYYFAIDAIVLSPKSFTPAGLEKSY